MAKITIDSYKDSVGGINEPFQELRDGLNVINQHWDDDGSYMYGDIIWREQGWQRGSIWYEGNFLYDSSGYLDNNSVIKKAITKMDDGSGRSWTSEINWSFHDIVNAGNSPEQWDSFLKTTYSGNDTIESTGGGSITANTYNGNDTITVSSGNNNNINGGSGNDSITINSNASGIFFGGDDHDEITNYSETAIANGGKGNDILNGGSSNNLLRGGNGRDVLTGGNGGDKLYGDFGLNTFTGERGDGYADEIYIKSDHLLYNHLYDKANNNTNGIKADKIGSLDSFDRIFIQGADTSQLSLGYVTHISATREVLSGVGIYADGVLEAVYVGEGLSFSDIQAMTFGSIG